MWPGDKVGGGVLDARSGSRKASFPKNSKNYNSVRKKGQGHEKDLRIRRNQKSQ